MDRRLLIATVANAVFVVVEISAGFYANSLSLVGDAFHNLTDTLALLLAFVAVRLERRPPTPERSFGYQRAGILSAFVNAGVLVGFTFFIFAKALKRFRAPEEVQTTPMLFVAVIALILNGGVTLWLREAGRHDVNIRSAVMHTFADALASAGVIIAALLIRWSGSPIFDPLVSIVIGVMILWSSWGILRETVNLLLEGTPSGIDPEAVLRDLAGEQGVLGVHHVHIWAIAPSRSALSCHLQLGDVSLRSAGEVLHRVSSMLQSRYRIAHTTIQFEAVGCTADDPFCIGETASITVST